MVTVNATQIAQVGIVPGERVKIVVSGGDRIDCDAIARLHRLGYLAFTSGLRPSSSELTCLISDADYYLLGGDEVLELDLLRRSTKLRCVSCLAVGAGHFVDVEAAKARGITVLNTPGMKEMQIAMAELALGHVIALQRGIVAFSQQQREGSSRPEMRPTLCGSTVGIVGLGSAGRRFAELLQPFGAQVVYTSRTRKLELERILKLSFVSLNELLAVSDVVVLLCSLNPDTVGLIDVTKLKIMKKTAYLVNTASGPLINGPALTEALRSSEIAGASTDDMNWHETPVLVNGARINLDRDLYTVDQERFFSTPYIGSLTTKSWSEMAAKAVTNLEQFISTGYCDNRV